MRFTLPITALLLLVTAFSVEASQKPPNVVFVLADDLGIGDVKCFGKDRCRTETPGFDQLAREGMMFTDAHPVFSVCVPSRVAIMTGRYPWRFNRPRPDGVWGYLNPRLATSQFTLARLMRGQGYRTGYVGKWHLGTLMHTTDGKNQGLGNVDFTKPLKIGPAQYGFDESFILPGSLDMFPYVFVRNNKFVGSVTAKKGWSAFNRVGPAAEDFEDYKVLDTFATQAEKFISNHAPASRAGKPFFLYLALTAPHTPISPSPAFEGKAKLGLYGDFVAEADSCIVRVLEALAEQGLAENTLVIATSDHGPAAYAGNIRKAMPNQFKLLQKLGHFSNGIYRGFKFSAYEGGLRVPLVVRWPAVIKPGSHCDRLVGLNDLMRTLGDVCNANLADDLAPDSISFLPLLKDPASSAPRKTMILQSSNSFVIRQGNWKLALCPGSGCNGHFGNTPPREAAWKKAVAEFGHAPRNTDELKQAPFVQLFDLENDPGENNNLAQKYPEKIAELIAILERRIADGRSTPGSKLKNDHGPVNYFAGVPKFVWQQANSKRNSK